MKSKTYITHNSSDQSYLAPALGIKSPHSSPIKSGNTKPTKRCARVLNEINSFLHKVGKIITEEGSKHTTVDTMPWCTKWQIWKSKHLFKAKIMKTITVVICLYIHYNQWTVNAVVNIYFEEITPINKYINITHLSDTLVSWSLRVNLQSLKSVLCGQKPCHASNKNEDTTITKNTNILSIVSVTSSRNFSLTSSRTL